MSSQSIGPVVKGRGVLPLGAFRRILESSPSPYKAPKGCVGHFLDMQTGKTVHIPLGEVVCRPVRVYGAASSRGSAASLSGCEDAAPYQELSQAASDFFDAGLDRTIVPAEKYGSYVIPVLSLPREVFAC